MSSCCFQSPITSLGSGQYWVNISVFDSNRVENNSFSVVFGGLYHFPLPIVVDPYGNPAPCRLDNPNDLDGGSIWTCMGTDSRFRIDTNPRGVDPTIVQLFAKSSGACDGSPVCSSILSKDDFNHPKSIEDDKVSLGALGNYDKGPVIAAFSISGFLVLGLLALYLYRNRHKDKTPGQSSNQIPSNSNDDEQLESVSVQKRDLPIVLDYTQSRSSSDIVTIKEILTKPKVKRDKYSKNLLAMMSEKSAKPYSSGPLIDTPTGTGREMTFRNEIDDDRSDQSNVPLALLYKNKQR